jgi:hypothetical protein
MSFNFPNLRDSNWRESLRRADDALRYRISSTWSSLHARWWHDDAGRAKLLRVGVPALLVLLAGLSVGGYFAFRPRPIPDFANERLDLLFDYTMLSDEFNRLPVEKRLELMKILVDRLKNMSAGDSMLMGAFAAGIAGAAREQIERNASRLAIDVWDKYAKDYPSVSAENREQFLEDTFVQFSKMMETVGGVPRDISDEDRVKEVKEQAKRDRERMGDPNRSPDGESLGRFFGFMNNNVGGHASPQQRVRGQQMLRDMSRHFRGQDVATGKDDKGPG